MTPLYDYSCEKCELDFEIFKMMSEHQKSEKCPECGSPAPQDFSRCRPHFAGTKIEDAEFNVGLGQITKSKRHRDELAKKLNVEEVGSEKPESIHKHFDTSRAEKMKKNWDDV